MPSGVFEMPPRKAAFIRRVESGLLEIFRKWGYQEVRTPAMEYMDVLERGLSGEEMDIAFKMVDRVTGRMMVLRPDVTPQVARMAALALGEVPRPLRLCYVADVYRYPKNPGSPRREMIQAGTELVGLDDPQADAEVIALAVESLKAIGLSGYRISLGQVDYARGLLAEAGLDDDVEDSLMEAAYRKDPGRMRKILDRNQLPPSLAGPLLDLALVGRGSLDLESGFDAVSDRCRAAIDNLRDIIDLLSCYGVPREMINVDLGELASFRYHTGVVFSGYLSGAGSPVLKGGRYDNLTGEFGSPSPATGFAIDILELVEIAAAGAPPEYAVSCMLVNRTGDRDKGLAAAMALRSRGRDVISLIRDMDDEGLINYALEHRVKEIVVLLENDRVRLIDPGTGQEQQAALAELE